MKTSPRPLTPEEAEDLIDALRAEVDRPKGSKKPWFDEAREEGEQAARGEAASQIIRLEAEVSRLRATMRWIDEHYGHYLCRDIVGATAIKKIRAALGGEA